MIARQPTVSHPTIAPDGTRLAYLSEFDARTDLFCLEAGGTARQITSDHAVGHSSYAWSPDGAEFVFTSAEDGRLWCCSSTGGRPRRVSRVEGHLHSPSFSPDGRFIAFLCMKGSTVDVMVTSVDGNWSKRINRGSDIPLKPAWSLDSRRLIWHAYPFDAMPWDQSELVVADVHGDQRPRAIATGSRVAWAQPAFSPNGERVVCVCDRGGSLNITEMRSDGSEQHVLHADAWEHGEPSYSPDGTAIVYTRNVNGSYELWTVPSGGGAAQPIVDIRGHATNPTWSPDGKSVVYLSDSPVEPPDIWRVDVASGNRTRLTDTRIGGIDPEGFVWPEPVHWTSPDGFEVQGQLYTPRTVQPGEHGCLVMIHGGPMNQSRVTWNGIVQFLIQRGWVVIQPNYRGSLGYGRRYREALFGSWGEGDLADNLGAIDLCAERGLIRRDRVVAWGGSAGGYSTFVCVTRAPDTFAAGIALYGLTDIYAFGLETHRYERYYVQTIMGPSSENYALWHERSPINYVDNISAPLLILQGAADPVVSLTQSDTIVKELERRNLDYEYRIYPGEGHGFRHIRHVIDSTERIDRFLRQKVLRAPEPDPLGVLGYPPMPLGPDRSE
jgi:dipeptidyl aminopeptidase/acylaminoacyl peptidase